MDLKLTNIYFDHLKSLSFLSREKHISNQKLDFIDLSTRSFQRTDNIKLAHHF